MKELIWTNRYSDTMDPDDRGRWARVGYLEHVSGDPHKHMEIAWINMLENVFVANVYIGTTSVNTFGDIDTAKKFCVKVVTDFYENY